MTIRESCPDCESFVFKKNGCFPNGKQSFRCRDCGRQFVMDFEQRVISDDDRELIKRLLCERLSLHGICRAVGVGMTGLMEFVAQSYEGAPDDLNIQLPDCPENIIIYRVMSSTCFHRARPKS